MTNSAMTSSTGKRLVADHKHLDVVFNQMLSDMHAGEWTACHGTWTRFERELLDHMDAEEKFVLPTFESVNPSETAALRDEHGQVRALLADMGVRLELHAVKAEHVERLVASLRDHAAREEALLYRWTEALSPDLQRAVQDRLRSHQPTESAVLPGPG